MPKVTRKMINLRNLFKYHPPKDEPTKQAHEDIRAAATRMAMAIDMSVPEGEEKQEAIKKVREAMMWSNADIAIHMDKSPIPDTTE